MHELTMQEKSHLTVADDVLWMCVIPKLLNIDVSHCGLIKAEI